MWALDVVGVAFVAGAVVSLATAGLTRRYRDTPGAVVLSVLLTSTGLWSASKLTRNYLVSGRTQAVLADRLVLLWGALTVACYLVFVLRFVGWGHLVDRRLLGLLAVEPAVVLVLSWANPFGEQLWRYRYVPAEGVAYAHGPAFQVHVGYSYLLLAVATLILVRAAVRTNRFYAGQFAAVVVGALVPWLANAFYMWGPLAVNLTPAAFTVTGVALAYAVARHDFMEVAPVARETLVETIDAAMFVLDDDDRLVDCNPAFVDLFDLDDATIGDPVAEVLAGHPELLAALRENADETVVELDVEDGRRYLAVSVSAVGSDGGSLGRLVLLHDVTDQQRRQRELERQNEQLDRFASVVAHDLRTPLTVARGRAELALESGDVSHVEDVVDAHERMADLLEEVHALARQGKTIDDPEPVELAAVARDAWETVGTADATLSVRVDGRVRADRDRLRRLFENLYENAVEHGGESVTVEVGRLDDGPGFYVADDGPGLPEGAGDQVFEWGFTDSEDGSGLGLAIVAQIARAHGWEPSVAGSAAGDPASGAGGPSSKRRSDGGARFGFAPVEWV